MSEFLNSNPVDRVDMVDTSYPGLMAGTKELIGAACAVVDKLNVPDSKHVFAAEMLLLSGLSLLMVADKGFSSNIHYDNLHIDGKKLPIQTVNVRITTNAPADANLERPSPVRSIKEPAHEIAEPIHAEVEEYLEVNSDPSSSDKSTASSEYAEAVAEWERDQQRFGDKPRLTDTGAKIGKRPQSKPAVPKRPAGNLHGGEK